MSNKTSPRSDVHRPSAIIPADYTHILWYATVSANGDPAFHVDCEREIVRVETDGLGRVLSRVYGTHDGDACCFMRLKQTVKFASVGGLGKCSVCGARYRRGNIWRHEPTGEYLHMGCDCSGKYELLADVSEDMAESDRREQILATALIREQNASLRQAFLDNNPGLEDAFTVDHNIINDIKSRFVKWCSISPAQVALVLKIANEVRNPTPKVEEIKSPAPTGKQTFRGIVVSVKAYESQYGITDKMVVKMTNPDGSIWLCFVTVPGVALEQFQAKQASLGGPAWGYMEALRGAEVELTATLARGKDEHFALGKRPRDFRVHVWAKQPAPVICHLQIDVAPSDFSRIPVCGPEYQGGPVLKREAFLNDKHRCVTCEKSL